MGNDLYYLAFFMGVVLLMSMFLPKQVLYYFLLLVLVGAIFFRWRELNLEIAKLTGGVK